MVLCVLNSSDRVKRYPRDRLGTGVRETRACVLKLKDRPSC